LENVHVRAEPSGREAYTDASGYFQIYVPVQTLAEATMSPATLVVEKSGHQSEKRQYLELWSEGDWVYRIRLESGSGEKIVDERQFRRRGRYPVSVKGKGDRRDQNKGTSANTGTGKTATSNCQKRWTASCSDSNKHPGLAAGQHDD
jgi:hypothetical protein